MTRIDLHGPWQLHQLEGELAVKAAVPGDVFGALLAAKAIPDPYVGRQEDEVQWVGEADWEYRRTVTVPQALLAFDQVFLDAESLDTVAEVRINGALVLRSGNMFLRQRREVKRHLQPGRNEIAIRFRSAVKAAAREARKLPFPVPSTTNNRIPHMNTLRKVQCHAGWDWGPCLVTAGIAGELALVGYDAARIERVTTTQDHGKRRCTVTVEVELHAARAGEADVAVELAGERIIREVRLGKGSNTVRVPVEIRDPELWWPAGYGAQPLYELTVACDTQVVRKRLGLRTMELVNEADEIGRSMRVRVNGVDVFCKGANWIPADAVSQRHTRAVFDDLLTSALDANMNMIRVWGGGQYELEDFYDLCDEKGLLVWQDLMFACALYPATEAFIATCREEVAYQVGRLRDHACIALWCGDNEVQGALTWYPESRANRDTYLVCYDRLNRALGEACESADPTRVFWPSSPCAGPGVFEDGWHNDRQGDMHYWKVWHDGANFDAYYQVVPRFCSEFGYQSFPSKEVVETFAAKDQWNVTHPVMEHHQRNPAGNQKIIEMFSRYFRMPTGFEQFLYLSQVQQAVAIKTAVEYWRHLQPVCMGAVYWQLNDNWPVASWSSLEYGGGWKQLHYHAKRFFAPVIAVPIQKDGEIAVHAVSDLLVAGEAKATLRLVRFDGSVAKTWRVNGRVRKQGVAKLWSLKLDALPIALEEGVLQVELTLRAGGKVHRHANTHFFAPYKRCDLSAAKVAAKVVAGKRGPVVELGTDAPAFFVTLTAVGIAGRFEDNSLTLLPGQSAKIAFHPRDGDVSPTALKRALRVEHLRESYR